MKISFQIILLLTFSFSFTGALAQEKEGSLKSALETENTYIGEYFSNLSGGIKEHGGEYRGNYNFTVSLDFEKAGLWKSGSFFVDFMNIHGEGITEKYVGDVQYLSNYDAPELTQVSEYYFTQSFFGDKLIFKLGKQDANCDFTFSENSLEFINSSFGVMPNVPMPTYPDPALGAASFINISEKTTLSAGIYDGSGIGRQWGFNTALDSDAVSFSIAELGYCYSPGSHGRIKLGAWRHGGDYGDYPEISGNGSKSTCFGGYLIVDQGLIGNTESGGFCLDSFFQYGYSDSKISEIPNYFGGGLKVAGFLQNRPEDLIGIGFASACINPDIKGTNPETSIELYYQTPILDFMAIQPDIQYIVNPGGNADNAFVIGIRFFIEL